MDDLKYITYQGQGFDQSVKAYYTFLSVGFQQRNKLTNQPAPNKINVAAITTNNEKINKRDQTVIRKFETAPENGI